MSISPLQDQLLHAVPTVDGFKVLEPAVLVEKLPEGGMAAVYRGMHLDLKLEVAVKVLKRNGNAEYSPQAVGRFRQEAEQAARLNDPNLVRIYDFPANRLGLLYLVMEYVDGETLESRIHRKGRLSPHESATIAMLTTRGLHTAHSEGVIHRDIKPPNILLSKRGRVKVTDLGIAKAQDSAAMGMTQEITLLGTPQYMAPELWRGARFASAASDVFAVGATLAFMLTGRHVMDGADTQEIMHRALTEGFPDIGAMAADVPPALVEIVRLCTLSDPKQRLSVDALLAKLNAVIAGFGGEYPLADVSAGSTVQPLSPTRFPSRSDLEVIRKKIDEIEAAAEPKPVPRTIRTSDDPATTAVAMQAFLGTPPPAAPAPRVPTHLPTIQHPPAQIYFAPAQATRAAKRKKKGVFGKLVALVIFGGLVTALVLFAKQEGWLQKLQSSLTSEPSTRPTTQLAVVPTTNPVTRPAATPTTNPSNTGIIATPIVPTQVDVPSHVTPATKPLNSLTKPTSQPTSPPNKPAIAATQPTAPQTKPAIAEATQPANPKPPVKPDVPVAMSGYEQSKKALEEDVRHAHWPQMLARLAETRRLAAKDGKDADFVATADGVLTAFRVDQPILNLRRQNYPNLPSQVATAYSAGSSVAALLMAEASLDYAGVGDARRLSSLDKQNGFAGVVDHLEKVKPDAQPQVVAAAHGYLLEARLRQVDFLAEKKDWSGMIGWLGQIRLQDLKKLRDAGSPEPLARAMNTVSEQLHRLWTENRDLVERQRIVRDPRPLAPFSDAGSSTASLLMAEGLMSYQGEGASRRMISLETDGSYQRIIELCEKARQTTTNPAIALAAGNYLYDAVNAGVSAAAAKRAWGTAVENLAKGMSLASPEQHKQWVSLAEKTLMDLRTDVPDLKKRRETYPELATQLEPLVNRKITAAMLLQAERFIDLTGDPLRAVPTAADGEFRLTLDLLSRVIRAPETPADVRSAATDREWEIYAYFARKSGEEKRPDKMLEKLKSLALCAATDTREADYGLVVDELFGPTEPKFAPQRTALAEHRMQIVESDRGLRTVSQKKESVLKGVRAMLMATRDSVDPKSRARANALLGEIELTMSQTPTSRVSAFNFFRDGTRTERQGEIADPVALMGLAWFYQLDDATLKAPEYADPSLEELRQMEASQRTLKALNLYREAARSGDAFANFLAGHYTDIALKRTEQNRKLVEIYLKAAIERGHKRAATYLAKVRSGE